MRKVIFLFSTLLFLTPCFSHEYHVAIIDMEHNIDSSSIEVSLKINTKDFNSVLRNIYKKKIGLNTEDEIAQSDSIIDDYLKQNLELSIDSIAKTYNFIGYEYEEEFTYVYIEFIDIQKITSLFVRCTLLSEIGISDHGHSHQSNLVNIKANGKTKSLYLNPHNREAKLEF